MWARARGRRVEALADVVDRAAAQAARPAERRAARVARPRARRAGQRLQRPRLRLVDPLDALGGRAQRHRGQHGRAQRGVVAGSRPARARGAAGRRRRLSIAPPSDSSSHARTRARPAGSASSSGVQQRPSRAARSPAVSRYPASASTRSLRSRASGGVSRSACSASSNGVGRGAASGRAGGGRGDRRRERARPGGPRRSAQVVGAQLLVGDGRRRARGAARAARAGAERLRGRRGEQRVRRAHAVAVDEQQPGVERVVDRVAARDRRELAEAQVAARARPRAALGARAPAAPRRACRAAPRPRPGTGISSPIAGGPRSTSARPTSSANSGLPSVDSTMRRSSGRDNAQAEPLGQQAARRVEARAGRPRDAQRAALERPLERGPATGAPGEQEARPARPRAAARRTRARPRTASSSHCTSSIATTSGRAGARARSAFRTPSAIACGSGGAPVGAARSSATSSAARCGAGQSLRCRRRRTGRSARRTSAAPRRRSAAPASTRRPSLARGVDPRLPQRRLADPGPAREDERAHRRRARDEIAQHRDLRLAPDDLHVASLTTSGVDLARRSALA